MLLADAFTGNSSKKAGLHLMREKFAQELNVILPPPQPGGWSAWGQPQDQVHGFFKKMNDDSTRALLGYDANLFTRPQFYQLELGGTGAIKKKVNLQDSFLARVKVFVCLCFYCFEASF